MTVDVLSNSALASPFLKYKASQLLQPLAPAAFTTAMMQKDFTLALQMAREVGVPLPATATANEVITMARGLGFGEQDFAAVADVIRMLSVPARTTKAVDERGDAAGRLTPVSHLGQVRHLPQQPAAGESMESKHLVRTSDQAAFEVPAAYVGVSNGFRRWSVVNRETGSVHQEFNICELDAWRIGRRARSLVRGEHLRPRRRAHL